MKTDFIFNHEAEKTHQTLGISEERSDEILGKMKENHTKFDTTSEFIEWALTEAENELELCWMVHSQTKIIAKIERHLDMLSSIMKD